MIYHDEEIPKLSDDRIEKEIKSAQNFIYRMHREIGGYDQMYRLEMAEYDKAKRDLRELKQERDRRKR